MVKTRWLASCTIGGIRIMHELEFADGEQDALVKAGRVFATVGRGKDSFSDLTVVPLPGEWPGQQQKVDEYRFVVDASTEGDGDTWGAEITKVYAANTIDEALGEFFKAVRMDKVVELRVGRHT